MALDQNDKKILDNFNQKYSVAMNTSATNIVKKADYDKTYLGTVLKENTRPDGSKRWLIGCDNGMSYEIKPEQSNIKEVGQKVRLYIPNHDYMRKYAEVVGVNVSVEQKLDEGVEIAVITIDGEETSLFAPKGGGGGGDEKEHPIKITYIENDEDYLDTVIEEWTSKGNVEYKIQLDENLEPIAIILPDGITKIELEGF